MGIEFYTEIGEEGTIKIPSSLKKIRGKVKVILRPIEGNDWKERKAKEIIHTPLKPAKNKKTIRTSLKSPEGWEEFEKLCDEISGEIKPWSREELHEL